ncbi:MAG: transglutaminase domain-containing protein [Chloroflexi bacterium]|nr:transglutaminase domain-containing protein [Chloroflexota bacterium]
MAEIDWGRVPSARTRSSTENGLRSWLARYFDWEDWLTLVLALAATVTVAAGLESTGWSKEMPALTLVAMIALVSAMIVARSRMSVFAAWPLAVFLGLLVTSWQTLDAVGPGTFEQRIDTIYERFNDWFGIAFNGGVSNDPLPFNTLVVGLTWLGTFLFGWSVFRWHHAWLGLIPGGVALFVGVVLVSDSLSSAVALYVLFGFLLVMRTNLTKRMVEWRAANISYPPFISLSFLHYSAWALLALLAAAWIAPSGPFSTPSAIEAVIIRIEGAGVDFVRLAGPLHVNKVIPVHSYTGVLPFQGSVNLGDRELLLVQVQDPTLKGPFTLRGAVYDEYGSGGWVVGDREELKLSAITTGQISQALAESDIKGRLVPLEVTLEAKSVVGTVIFTPGQPVGSDSTASVQFPAGSLTTVSGGLFGTGTTLSDDEVLRRWLPDWLIGTSVKRDPEGRVQYIEGFDTREQVLPDATKLDPGGRVKKGESYKVTGFVPTMSDDDLRDAGGSYPAWVSDQYLELPGSVTFRVRNLAREIAALEPTAFDKAEAIEQHLRDFYPIDYNVADTPPGEDTVDYFLFEGKRGFFDYHASAMVVMLRVVRVPARLAVGFVIEESDVQGDGTYLVRDRNAYTWTEVYFPTYGWIPFNPSPDRPADLTPKERDEPNLIGGFDLSDFPNLPVGADPIFPGADGLPSAGDFGGIFSTGTSSAPNYMPWLAAGAGLIIIMVAGSAAVGWRRSVQGLPYPQQLWEKTVRLSRLAGHGPGSSQTPSEFAVDLQRAFRGHRVIGEITSAYNRSRFGRSNVDANERARLERQWRPLRNAMIGRMVSRLLKRGKKTIDLAD